MSDRISVVIVNFNAGEHLRAAVGSVLAQDVPGSGVIVVDNNSTDGSLGSLDDLVEAGQVKIVRKSRNTGFADACNVGIAESGNADILLLNPDCEMTPGSLGRLIKALDDIPAAGIVGPLLVNSDGSEQRGGRRDVPNPWQIFCFIMQFHRLMPNHPRFRNFNRAGDELPDQPSAVAAVSGACMLIRRATLDRIGHLDSDNFFLHFEDLDLCLRAERAGFDVLFIPDAVVRHAQGVSSAKRPLRVELQKHRSLVRFLRKHFTRVYPVSFMAVVSFLVAIRFALIAAGLLFHRRPAPLLAGYPMGYSPARSEGAGGEHTRPSVPGDK